MQSKTLLFTFVSLLLSSGAFSQSPGDTITIQSFNFQSSTRDTVVQFPANSNVSYEKVYMQYSLRCKNAQVSTVSNRNRGCGEWDYSCNTYLHDSSHVDSIQKFHPSHIISGFSGNVLNYTSLPTFDFHQTLQPNVTINNITSDTASLVGTGMLSLSTVLPTDTHAAKSQYIFTQAELSAAGVTAGNIDALTLNVNGNPGQARLFRLKMKATTKSTLDAAQPDLTGFTEVYFHNTFFSIGDNRLQFSTPFIWDGTSNIIVEMSFTNKTNGNNLNFSGTSGGSGLLSEGDFNFDFNGSNYIEAQSYKGIQGSGPRTVEAWINTLNASGGEEIVSWGTNATGEKWLVRLNNLGRIRVEVNGGNSIGTTSLDDGNWHHIAVTSDGTNANNIKIYVDGQLETISASQSQIINTTNGTNLRINKGHHNKFFTGNIGDIHVWSIELSAQEIQDWMYRKVDATHPKYNNLEVYYPLAEESGTQVYDASGNGHDAVVYNGANWSQLYGNDHFKNMEMLSNRPNTTFHQGQYNLTITTDTIIDSVMRPLHIVDEYAVFSKAGTAENDSLGIINTNQYWEAGAQYIYDPIGNVAGTLSAPSQGTVNITDLKYFERNPSKFEILSFVTPYGIGIDFGQEGKTWTFDLSDFTPILNGRKRISVERGGQWQEEMDIKFLMVVGTPPRDVLDVQQIWKVEKKPYSSIDANESFEPRHVSTDPQGNEFKIRTAITGHGQQGEFIPRTHWVNINGGTPEFSWQVWKECALNPVYPQGGTWIYDRAGWCPGMPTDVKEWDITSYVTPGQTVEIDYGISTASGTSNYIVNHQMVTYGAPNHALDAAVVDIISPNNYVEYGRMGRICDEVEVIIQNTGSTTLTNLQIDYWVNNASTPQTYQWSGSLEFMEQQTVLLPVNMQLWADVTGNNDVINVSVNAPNGGSDGYALNNKKQASFEIPEVIPDEFFIDFRTNNTASQNSFKITDESGAVILSRSNFSNNLIHRDTVRLPVGCYTFELTDAGDNGISFWANNEGNGALFFRDLNGISVKNFQPDFGKSIVFPFTVMSPLATEENTIHADINLYPNPTKDQFSITTANIEETQISVFNNLGQKVDITGYNDGQKLIYNISHWSRGVYFIHIKKDAQTHIKKLIVL